MKRINDHMDIDKPNRYSTGQCCTSYLHKVFQQADTATTRRDAELASDSLQNIQNQCCKLIYDLSMNETINRDNADELPTDFIESESNDLITFIAGVGVACGQVVDRLQGFESSEHYEELRKSST